MEVQIYSFLMLVSGKSHTLIAVPPGKDPQYALNRKLARLRNQSGRETTSCLCQDLNPVSSSP